MVGCYGFGIQAEKELGQLPYPSIYSVLYTNSWCIILT